MLFGLPVVMVVMFGFALTNEIKDARIAVLDNAKDESSQRITEKLKAVKEFSFYSVLDSPRQIDDAIKSDHVKMVVIFPAGFHRDLIAGNRPMVQLIADASDPNTATTLTGYASQIIGDYAAGLPVNSEMPYHIVPEVRMIYNAELRSAVNFVPGVISTILLLLCVLMTSVSIVKEKEKGTMEVLLVSPLNPFLIVVSKAIPYLLLSLVNLSVILFLSVWLLSVPLKGSLVLLYAVSTLFITTALSLGLFVSNIAKTQEVAMLVSLLGMLIPSLLFTGFIFPLENMPYILQLISHLIPAKWFYIIIKSVMIKGLGLAAIWKEALILLSMTIVLLGVNIRLFKTRLE